MESIHAMASRAKALRSTDINVRCYLLMDMRAHPELSIEFWRSASKSCHRLWQGTPLESHEDISPLLIEIDLQEYDESVRDIDAATEPRGPLARCLAHMDQTPTDRYAITGILSPKDGETLAHHYRSYCDYDLADGRGYYLHFYDARILARLRRVWNAPQSAAFIGPAYELHYWQRDGTHMIWKNAISSAIAFEPGQIKPTLTEQQHDALLQEDYPDKLTLQLRRLYPALLAVVPHEPLYGKVVEQLARARRHGLEHERDLFDYVSCALTTSARFDQHPRVLECLQQLKSSPATLGKVLSTLPDEVWEEVALIAE